MANSDFPSFVFISIDAPSTGKKELTTVKSFDPTDKTPLTAVKAMTRRRRPLGFTRGIPDLGCTLEIVIEKGTPEVDWRALKRSGETFQITYEEEPLPGQDAGKKFTYRGCQISDADPKYNADGDVATMTVTIVATDHVPEV